MGTCLLHRGTENCKLSRCEILTCFLDSRAYFAAARDGILPDMFSGVHRTFKTPMPATLLQVGFFYAQCSFSSLHAPQAIPYGKMGRTTTNLNSGIKTVS